MTSTAGRPEIGPATNLRLGEELTARIDARRQPGEDRAPVVRRLLDTALDYTDLTAPPNSVAYGIGMAHGARIALQILDECTPEQIAAYVSGDKLWPSTGLDRQPTRHIDPYTYIDLARDMGRTITWDDVNFTDEGDPWLDRIADAYSQGHITVLRGIVEAAHYAGRAELAQS